MKLLTLDAQGIEEYVNQLDEKCKDIKANALHLSWLMRGSVQYNEVLMMSPEERDMISKIAKDNIEITNKTGQPYF